MANIEGNYEFLQFSVSFYRASFSAFVRVSWKQSFSLFFEPEEFFLPIERFDEEPKGGLSIIRGWSVIKIDADKKLATLDDGTQIEYGKCLLATGVRPKVVAPFDKLENFKNKVIFVCFPENYFKCSNLL